MFRKTLAVVVSVIATVGLSLTVLAESPEEDAFDYRIAIMTTLKGHLVAASMVLRGKAEDNGYLIKHAQSIADSVAEMPHIFQAGSNVGDSEALAVIWEQPDEFKAAIDNAKKASTAFAKAVASGDDAAKGAAFKDLGGSCRGCHDEYRVPHD